MIAPHSSFEERFATAFEYAEAGDLMRAVPLLSALARERPAVTQVRYLLMRCLLHSGSSRPRTRRSLSSRPARRP